MPKISDPALLAQLETPQTAINKTVPGAPVSASKAGLAAQQRQQNMLALGNAYARVKSLYDRDLKGAGIGSILEYLPLPRNKAFDSAAAGMSDVANAVFKVPGMGAQSDADFAQFVRANQPRAADPDAQIESKLANIKNRLVAGGVKIPGERGPKVLNFHDLPE